MGARTGCLDEAGGAAAIPDGCHCSPALRCHSNWARQNPPLAPPDTATPPHASWPYHLQMSACLGNFLIHDRPEHRGQFSCVSPSVWTPQGTSSPSDQDMASQAEQGEADGRPMFGELGKARQ